MGVITKRDAFTAADAVKIIYGIGMGDGDGEEECDCAVCQLKRRLMEGEGKGDGDGGMAKVIPLHKHVGGTGMYL